MFHKTRSTFKSEQVLSAALSLLVPSVPVFNPVPAPRVPVVPNNPVPVLVPNAVPVPNVVGLAPKSPPAWLVAVLNALVPSPPALAPKLKPVAGLFCAPNKVPVAPVPKANTRKI